MNGGKPIKKVSFIPFYSGMKLNFPGYFTKITFLMSVVANSMTDISVSVPTLYVSPGLPLCIMTSKAFATSDT